MIYTEKLNKALQICSTESVPSVVKETLLDLVQQVQEAKISSSGMDESSAKATCQCGKKQKRERSKWTLF
jgi:hypothetical protein